MLRVGVRLFFATIFFSGGIVLLAMSLSDQEWFTAALGAVAVGKAMHWIGRAVGVRSTGRVHFAFETSFRAMAMLFIVAGALALIGALRSLGGGFALVVAFAAVCWMWGWGWFLLRSRRWFQPRPDPAVTPM